MKINKYRAKSLKTAIDKAKAELGPDAKVVHVRQLDENAASGTDEKVEIIAAAEDEDDDEQQAQEPETAQIESVPENRTQNQHAKRSEASSAYAAQQKMLVKDPGEQLSESDILGAMLQRDIRTESSLEVERRGTVTRGQPDQVSQTDAFHRPRVSATTSFHNATSGKMSQSTDVERQMEKARMVPRRNVMDNQSVLQTLHKCCLKNEVNKDITYEILSLLNDDGGPRTATARDYLSLFISKQISISGGLDTARRTAILIGPTGVGKTTTLAKLAAQYHFQHGKSVGLITIDAYRIAAIDQLRTYAQIMSIPLKVALTPKELESCIKDYRDMDVILVDTPGRSQFDANSLHGMADFLDAAQPADIHLLMAVSTKESDAYTVVDNFAPDYVRQLIFTKVDETSSFGSILNICTKVGKPVSYFTNGQNVPDDIEVAQVERMVDLFMSA